MKFITNRISTGKATRFEDFVKEYQDKQVVKTASVKTAEEDEAKSSGQLDVEPLHQEGESTTMPKNGPSAKKDTDNKSAAATDPDAEGPDSGQPKAEGSEKFTNDPEAPTKEEKSSAEETEVKEAELTPAQEKLPDALKEKIRGTQEDNKDSEDSEDNEDNEDSEDNEVKEAGKTEKGKRDGTGPFEGSAQKEVSDKGKRQQQGEKCPKKDDKKASEKTQFVKIANLDTKNKNFLKTYWRQLFGDDYVNALIADK
jgi:hypothetical protein